MPRAENRCTVQRQIREDAVQAWLDVRLRELISADDVTWLHDGEAAETTAHLAALRKQLDDQRRELRGLLRDKARAMMRWPPLTTP